MTVALVRTETSGNGTFGALSINGNFICHTCELPWKDNQRKISCIPKGTYTAKLRNSTKYGDHWHIQNVKDRDMILIHHGNTIKDIEGCILVGLGRGEIDDLPAIVNSRKAMEKLRQLLPSEFEIHISGVV